VTGWETAGLSAEGQLIEADTGCGVSSKVVIHAIESVPTGDRDRPVDPPDDRVDRA
jgi:hypothetical protein